MENKNIKDGSIKEENIDNKDEIEKKESIGNLNENNYEYENMKADKLTNIANTLIIIIPITIWFISWVCSNLFIFRELIIILNKLFTPISILVGLTLLIYIRIKHPNNVKSKKLVKTCIFAAIVIAILYAILFATCINILQNCNMPG